MSLYCFFKAASQALFPVIDFDASGDRNFKGVLNITRRLTLVVFKRIVQVYELQLPTNKIAIGSCVVQIPLTGAGNL